MSTQGALVAIARVRPHPGADRLQLAQVGGFQVVVGMETHDGDIVLFFSSELQLSEEYATANDCVGYTDPETGEKRGGYFGRNRKVRPQKFRGERSDGYIAPLESLDRTVGVTEGDAALAVEIGSLKVGEIISEWNGVSICNKFVSKATKQFQGTPKTRKEYPLFHKHVDTEQLGYYYQDIPVGALVTITGKIHGTSQRSCCIPEEKLHKRTIIDRLKRRTRTYTEWVTLHGTRNVVLDGAATAKGWYADESFRVRAAESLVGAVHRGETWYYEVVGWAGPDSPIMPPFDLTGSKDFKKIGKGYFSYGAPEGTCDIYVYRITHMIQDVWGNWIHRDLPWGQVQRRANDLGVKTVFQLDQFVATDPEAVLVSANLDMESGGDFDWFDPTTLKEGVVVRVDHYDRTYWLKSKTLAFKINEGIIKEQEDSVDLEEVS